ncbi:hypothetical protein M3Y97_01001100 [Aphelenchoides bicaudatus]|nr:hypothetical protein M3Y97_01001100 [Aphelenchoides bicaudatus]
MTADYKERAEMNICCLDVTVDSFFWSERVKQLEPKVNAIYNPRREQLAEWQKVGVPDLLAATEDLLIPEKASSYKQRIATKSNISNFRMKEGPKDRGGRTGEIIAPIRESFSEQQRSRGGGGHRGNRENRGGGHRNRPY